MTTPGYGPAKAARDLAAIIRLDLGQDGRDALDAMLATNPDNGQWKSGEFAHQLRAVGEIRALAGLFVFGDQRIIWRSRTWPDAANDFHRIRLLIASEPTLSAQVQSIRATNGNQRILLHSGQQMSFIAGRHAGRGLSADVIVVADAVSPHEVRPHVAGRPNPQIIWVPA